MATLSHGPAVAGRVGFAKAVGLYWLRGRTVGSKRRGTEPTGLCARAGKACQRCRGIDLRGEPCDRLSSDGEWLEHTN